MSRIIIAKSIISWGRLTREDFIACSERISEPWWPFSSGGLLKSLGFILNPYLGWYFRLLWTYGWESLIFFFCLLESVGLQTAKFCTADLSLLSRLLLG